MVNIAWITSGFYRDENDFRGAAAIHHLAREVSSDSGIRLSVFSLYYPYDKDDYILHGAKVYTFNTQPIGRLSAAVKLKTWLRFRKKFSEVNRQDKFDIIHSFWAAEPGFNAAAVSEKYGIPLAANICGGELAGYPEIGYGLQLNFKQRYLINKTLNTAQVIVCGSDFVSEKASEYYDRLVTSKIKKIPFGVDEDIFDPEKFQRTSTSISRRPVLINIAHALPVKAHKDLLAALKIVKEEYPEILLQVFGSDEHGFIQQTATEMGLKDNVVYNGNIEHGFIPQALKDADVFVLSSVYESQNISMLEAAFMGLPVVSTDVGVAREITPYVSAPGDTRALAMNIISALKQPKPGYQKLNERFSLRSSADGFINLYKDIIKRRI